MRRLLVLFGVALALGLLSGCDQPPTLVLDVTTTADGRDAAPGDGVCEMTDGGGDCSLRAAVDEANAYAGLPVRIRLVPATTYVLTRAGDDDTNDGGDLDLAPANGTLAIEAQAPGATIDAAGAGAALDIRSGTVTDIGVGATGAATTAWRVRSGATADATRVSIHDNDGAGVTVDAGATASIANATISTNGGVGITNLGTVSIVHATVTANSTGLGGTGSTTLDSSIVADQTTGGADCAAPVTSADHNLASDGSCALTGANDQSGVDPQLGPLVAPGPAHVPVPGSPAIDAVPYGDGLCRVGSTQPIDQLGQIRPSGVGCDLGAVEVGRPTFVVLSAADAADATPGDGVCLAAGGGCTLRAAIQESNAVAGPATVFVANGVDPVLSVAGVNEDAGATGDLDITDDLLLIGNGRTVDAAGLDRVLDVHDGAVTIHGLAAVGGYANGGGGGGIRNAGGELVVRSSTVAGNHSWLFGGGIAQVSGSLQLDRSTVRDNAADSFIFGALPQGGGGLHVADGDVTVVGSTFTGNRSVRGGAVMNQGVAGGSGHLRITSSTIVKNEGSGIHGGIAVDDGGLSGTQIATVLASTISGNSGPALEQDVQVVCVQGIPTIPICRSWHGGGIEVGASILANPTQDCFGGQPEGTSTSLGYNQTDPGLCMAVATDRSGRPRLGPLGVDGPTAVQVPFADSPVLDAIPAGTPLLCDASIATDQRGATRPAGSACDIGAVEGSNGITPTARSFVVDDASDVHDALAGDGACATASATCTLRAAVDEANAWPGADTITIAAGIDPELALAGTGAFVNDDGDLDVDDDLTIDGGGATIDANGIDRAIEASYPHYPLLVIGDATITGGSVYGDGGAIHANGLHLDHVTVQGNHASENGGGVSANDLTVTDVVVADNTADGSGGGLVATTLDATRITVTDNQAGTAGGGMLLGTTDALIVDSTFGANVVTATDGSGGGAAIAGYADIGPTVISGSTFDSNVAARGGGLRLDLAGGTADLTNVTISGNIAGSGAGLSVEDGTTTLGLSTVAGNVATTDGGVIAGAADATVAVRGSVLASASADCAAGPIVTTGGFNVGADPSCALNAATDVGDVDPELAPLANNGGPTATRLPFAGSPVLDLIPTGTATLCDGTVPTDQRGEPRPASGACDAGAVEGSGSVVVVPLALVVTDAADGHDALAGDGLCATATATCTLRAAVDEANAWPGADSVTIGAGVDPVLTLAGRDDDANASGDLDVTDALALHGAGATVDARGVDRVLDLLAPTSVDRLTVIGGDTGDATAPDGGAVRTAADVTLTNVTVTSSSTRGAGAGLAATAGTATLRASTLSLGTSDQPGGAIVGAGGSVVLSGSAIDGQAPLCAGSVTSTGYNVAGDASCATTAPSDVVVEPALGPVRTVSGSDVHLPYAGSPVVGAIPAGTAGLCDGSNPIDERGAARPTGSACDIGATEGDVGFAVPAPAPITVTATGDQADALAGDGICATATATCTLRAAIDEANARPGPDTIGFDSARSVVLTQAGTNENGNRRGDLDLNGDLVLHGAGSTVDANSIDRVLHQRIGTLQVEDLTLRRGRITDVGGRGGVILAHGDIGLVRTTVTSGSLTGGGAVSGGGIAMTRGSITIDASTVSGSSAAGFSSRGGGIWLGGGETANLTITRSTISGNGAFGGAAIATDFSGGFEAVHITASTIAGGAGGLSLFGTITSPDVEIAGSIVDATGLSSCGILTSRGWNVFTTSCSFSGQASDLVDPAVGLGALGANGGPTPTRLPGPGSSAIGHIPVGTSGLCDATTPTDQRGVARPQGAACDAGAVEQ